MKVKLQIVKFGLLGVASVMSAMLMSCSYINDKVSQNPPTVRQQQCSVLKDQLSFGQSSPGVSGAQHVNVSQQAEIMRMHDKGGCGKFEGQSQSQKSAGAVAVTTGKNRKNK